MDKSTIERDHLLLVVRYHGIFRISLRSKHLFRILAARKLEREQIIDETGDQ